MPTYKVLVQRFAEQVAIIEVEAEAEDEARQRGLDRAKSDLSVAWREGDEIEDTDVYAVQDADNQLIWER